MEWMLGLSRRVSSCYPCPPFMLITIDTHNTSFVTCGCCNRFFEGFPDTIGEYPDVFSQITKSHQQVMLDKCCRDRADNANVFDNMPNCLVGGRPSHNSMMMLEELSTTEQGTTKMSLESALEDTVDDVHVEGHPSRDSMLMQDDVPTRKRAIDSLSNDAEEEMSQPKKKTRVEEESLVEEAVDESEDIDAKKAFLEDEPGAQAGEELHYLTLLH